MTTLPKPTSRTALALAGVASALSVAGCYTGHALSRDRLAELSIAQDPAQVRSIETDDKERIPVTNETVIVVTDDDGLQHPLQAFTFQVSSTQLVAPEQDLILSLQNIEGVQVRRISTLATLGLIGIGIGTAATAGVIAIATAGDQSFD